MVQAYFAALFHSQYNLPMRLSTTLFVLLLVFKAPTSIGAQDINTLQKVAARVLFGLETADTSAQSLKQSDEFVPADTLKAQELTFKATFLLQVKKYPEAREAAEAATAIYAQLNIENEKALFAWNALKMVCYYTENYNRALEAGEATAAICRKIYPETHPKVLASYNDLGVLYSSTGNHDKALEILGKALELSLQLPDVCTSNINHIYKNIGTQYMHKAQYAKALEYYEKEYQIAVQCDIETTWAMVGIYIDLATASWHLGDLYKPIGYLEKGALLAERLAPPIKLADIDNAIDCYDDLGRAYGEVHAIDKAKVAYDKALSLKLKFRPTNYISISDSYNNLASNLIGRGDYKSAAQNHEKAIAILSKSAQGSQAKLAYYYGNLAMCINHLGDTRRAIELQEHALNLKLIAYGPDHPGVTGSYHNLAWAFSDIGEYEQALRYFDLAINTFIKSVGEMHIDVATFYSGIGATHRQMGNTQKAAEYYRRALEIYAQVYREDQPTMANTLYNLGALYAPGGDLEAAVRDINRGIAINATYFGPHSAQLAGGYTVLGSVLKKAGRFDDAERAFRSALTALDADNPDISDNSNTSEQRIGTHTAIAVFYQNWYRQHPDPALLITSQHHYAEALAALNRLSRSVSPASKSTLAAQAADICAGAIATNLRLRTRTDSLRAFDFAERSKAFVLFETMKDADALHIAGIPDSLLQHERNLRIEIAFYENLRQEKQDSIQQRADTTLLAIGTTLLHIKQQHEDLIHLFEIRYPEYYQAKYGLATANVAAVQHMLQPGQTLLEYTIGDSSIFAFIVRPDYFSVHELPRDFPLEQTVDTLTRLGIYAYYTLPKAKRSQAIEKSSVRHYTNAARLLYEKLVAPLAGNLTVDLIIIPDGVLGYVPFEALLSGEPSRHGVFSSYEPHFLLRRHRISYGASATLLREMRDKKHHDEPVANVLALAPFFRGDTAVLHARADSSDLFALREAFGPLPSSGDEAYAVTTLFGGSALYGPDASREAFCRLAPKHRILHLSTHGKADDRLGDYAYLALGVPGDTTAFDKLYARDLYSLGLHADLVVLSACETATGKLRRGEGIVSLARAFSFAGAKSLVTSLWKVDDTTTKDLMTGFYRHLHDGEAKDAALQQAKFDFLENKRDADGGAKLHPFFWAGFIAVGDMRALH